MASYESTIGKLKSKIKLIKPATQTIFYEREDFGLSEFSELPVEIIYVDGDHVTVLESVPCADEINKLFSEESVLFKQPLVNRTPNLEVRDQPTLA